MNCSLAGIQEEDQHSRDVDDHVCQPSEAKELIYLTYTYDPESALQASPTDRVEVIKRITGVTVHPNSSWSLLSAIVDRDYYRLYRYQAWIYDQPGEVFGEWIESQVSDFEMVCVLLLGRLNLYPSPSLPAFARHANEVFYLGFHDRLIYGYYHEEDLLLQRQKRIAYQLFAERWNPNRNGDSEQIDRENALILRVVQEIWDFLVARYR